MSTRNKEFGPCNNDIFNIEDTISLCGYVFRLFAASTPGD